VSGSETSGPIQGSAGGRVHALWCRCNGSCSIGYLTALPFAPPVRNAIADSRGTNEGRTLPRSTSSKWCVVQTQLTRSWNVHNPRGGSRAPHA
jgi:hypothetical protein